MYSGITTIYYGKIVGHIFTKTVQMGGNNSKKFTETGCLCKQKSSGRPLTAEDYVERVRASFLHSPKKSTGTAAKELSISKTTVWRVLPKRLVFKPYRIQMVQQVSDEDHRRRFNFCLRLQDLVSSGYHFLERCSSVTKRHSTSAVK